MEQTKAHWACVLRPWKNCADMLGGLQVAEWLVERAKAVEQTTGQLGLCARLLKLALAQAEAAEGAFAPQAQQLTDSIKKLQAAMRAGKFRHLPSALAAAVQTQQAVSVYCALLCRAAVSLIASHMSQVVVAGLVTCSGLQLLLNR